MNVWHEVSSIGAFLNTIIALEPIIGSPIEVHPWHDGVMRTPALQC